MFRQIFRKMMLPKLIAVCILVLLVIPLQSANAQDSVITTNIPAPGGTQGGLPFRLIPPKYGDYSNMETDPTSITSAERDAVIAQFAKDDPTPLAVVNLWSDVKENQKALQIVNNVPIGGGLYTIILPPGLE